MPANSSSNPPKSGLLNAQRAELGPAYRATDYCLEIEGERHILHIDAPAPDLTAWMNERGLRRLVVFTACNPGSQPTPAEDNARRQRHLEQAVADHGLRAWPARNRDPRGQWPDEPGLMIAEVSDALLAEWLERFGQNAAVLLEPPAAPRLVWHPALAGRDDGRRT